MAAIETLHDLFIDELKDLLNAEGQLVEALPAMAEAAQSKELKKAIKSHLQETKEHARRLTKVLKSLGEDAEGETCKAMKGILAEGKSLLKKVRGAAVDSAIIAAGQKVEHYEIASYGTVCAFAKIMGHENELQLLLMTLEEEKKADATLSQISETVNEEANATEDAEAEIKSAADPAALIDFEYL